MITDASAIESLAASYRRAEEELRRDLERYVRQAELDPDSTARYRAAQRRAALTRIAILRADLDGQAVLFGEETLARIYADGMNRTDRILREGRISIGQPSFTLLHRDAVEMMAVDAFNDLAAATDYMDRQAKRTIREAAKLRTQVGAITGATVGQDTRRLVDALVRDGITGFVDAAGHRWRLGTYAEMVIRTKSAQAYNTGTILRTEETGTRALEILDGERSEHAECLAFNRTTASPRWAVDHPILHPNCVRAFSPLPLFTGVVDHGAELPSARAAIQAEARRRQEAGITSSSIEVVAPDNLGG